MMTLTAADRDWLTLAVGVAIPYVATALGAILVAELHQRGQAKAQAKAKTQQEKSDVQNTSPVSRVVTYCPECAKQALANRRMAMPPTGIQALCDEHQRVPVYVPESIASTQNAQPLIRRIPVQFAEPTQAAWQAEQRAEAEMDAEGQRLLADVGDRWIIMWAYVDPIDPVWN